jgi:hypothetical protein
VQFVYLRPNSLPTVYTPKRDDNDASSVGFHIGRKRKEYLQSSLSSFIVPGDTLNASTSTTFTPTVGSVSVTVNDPDQDYKEMTWTRLYAILRPRAAEAFKSIRQYSDPADAPDWWPAHCWKPLQQLTNVRLYCCCDEIVCLTGSVC